MRTQRLFAAWHKWVGLIVGVQVIAWFVSGLYMTAVPIEEVRGEHLIAEQKQADLAAGSIADLNTLIAQVAGPVTRVEVRAAMGRSVVQIDGKNGPVLFDAVSGAQLSPIDETLARAIAEADFAPDAAILSARLYGAGEEVPLEYRRETPVWRFDFADADETHIYVSALTARVVARRTATWRIYDFLWGLHIMDWREHEDFNHWPVVTATAIGLLLTLTGVVLLVYRLWPRRRRRPANAPPL